MTDRHLTPEDLAEREGVPLETVYSWNKAGLAPPRMKIGRHVRYRLADVERWEESRIIGAGPPGAERRPAGQAGGAPDHAQRGGKVTTNVTRRTARRTP